MKLVAICSLQRRRSDKLLKDAIVSALGVRASRTGMARQRHVVRLQSKGISKIIEAAAKWDCQ